jgi:putative transposase
MENRHNAVRSGQTPSPFHSPPVRARRAVPQPLPAGAYFVTICTRERECLFGEIEDGEMRLNPLGEMAAACWHAIPHHFPRVVLDAFMVMPNHMHGIIVIHESCRGEKSFAPTFAPTTTAPTTATAQSPSKTIGSIVRGFKIGVSKWFRANTDLHSIWQRNYHEHVIRTDEELKAIREYIVGNPARWNEDENNPTLVNPGLMSYESAGGNHPA